MDKGCYCLVFNNPACSLRVGALGELPFARGWHIYIGSALGPGGLSRLTRHLRLARMRNRQPKWHVDYLLTDPRFTLAFAVSAMTPERFECRLAAGIGGRAVPHFGCSDCTCGSHLLYRDHDPADEIMAAFARLGLAPHKHNTHNPRGEG